MNVVIVAAGSSSRFNNKIPKPFVEVAGRPLLWYSISSFNRLSFVNKIIVVISKIHRELAEVAAERHFGSFEKFSGFVDGGAVRQESVSNALSALKGSGSGELVAIHDAARPFLKGELVERLNEEAGRHGAAAPGIAVVDTIKGLDSEGFIKSHLKRESLIAIQTPQVFHFEKLLDSYERATCELESFTDDTEIYSRYHGRVKIVEGDKELFKVTFEGDLARAEEVYKRNSKLWI